MKLTKTCMYPWTFMQIHAGGMMQPCAVGPDTDLGDFLIDYIDLKKDGKDGREDFLNNMGLQKLREGMLTGNLRPMCQNCFFCSNDLITVEEFRKRLTDYLGERMGPDFDPNKADLTQTYAYNWMAISFTNRCNLRCIYCVQSVYADTNPYFKAEIPYEYADDILDMMASKGIMKISTCVEGEATLYKHWCDVFTRFHDKYPDIEMLMTTNLNREYSDKDIELLTKYSYLDISIDSLNPELYNKLRVNGRLDLLFKNLDKIDAKIKELNVRGPKILLHMVVSTLTWTEIEDVAEFAFSRGYGIQLGNYEVRANTVANRDNILKPVDCLDDEDKKKMRDMVKKVINKAEEKGIYYVIQGDIFSKVNKSVEKNYHRFAITDNNPIYEKFLEMFPNGTPDMHFDVVYDRDNISYAGILIKAGKSICLDGIVPNLPLIYREVLIYREGSVSKKYNYRIEPGFRKKMTVSGMFKYTASDTNEQIEAVLLDISEVVHE